MQNAKDTFYSVLRDRLAALNPDRTVVVRGVTRPGVLVQENELSSAVIPAECFLLRWGKLVCETAAAMPTVSIACEIVYATAGMEANGGMDRGRTLTRLDAELLACLGAKPQNAALNSFSAGSAPVALATRIWWSDPAFGELKVVGDRLQRSAGGTVMSLREAGEE